MEREIHAVRRSGLNTSVQRAPYFRILRSDPQTIRPQYNTTTVKGGEYRDRVAGYIHANFNACGLIVYVEVPLGKTIIGKNRRLDLLVLRPSDQVALALECKFQAIPGTTDEKIPYALQDLDSMWLPGALVYAGKGWSPGVLHTLEGARNAIYCDPDEALARTKATIELDHVLASVFGLWDKVIPENLRFMDDQQLALPGLPLARAGATRRERTESAG